MDMQVLCAHVSTKGSNVENAVNASREEHDANVILTMGLYVQEIKYVKQALDIFIAWPTNLVKVVSHEDSHVTPKKVVEHVQRLNDVGIEDPLCQLIRTMYDIYDKPVELLWDGSKFGIPNSDASFFLTYSDVNEIMSGDQCLNIAILQLFMMFMDKWSSTLGHGLVYGFLELQSIDNAKDKRVECQHYIETWAKESQ
ncbi:hypothetical protein GmHk_09G025211 [Glycine max]|nr:hypothetical protein GmHk_09G025211 [Glycine max]